MPDELHEPIHVFVPYERGRDPLLPYPPDPPGIVITRGPALHPDDLDVVDGIQVTSVGRTLIDCAQDATYRELRDMLVRSIELGIFDAEAMQGSLDRVEWRPSLTLMRTVLRDVLGPGAPG